MRMARISPYRLEFIDRQRIQPTSSSLDRVERALVQRADADALGRKERRFLAERVADPDFQRADRHALLDRRHDRPLIDDARDQLVAVGDRHQDR